MYSSGKIFKNKFSRILKSIIIANSEISQLYTVNVAIFLRIILWWVFRAIIFALCQYFILIRNYDELFHNIKRRTQSRNQHILSESNGVTPQYCRCCRIEKFSFSFFRRFGKTDTAFCSLSSTIILLILPLQYAKRHPFWLRRPSSPGVAQFVPIFLVEVIRLSNDLHLEVGAWQLQICICQCFHVGYLVDNP